MRAIIQAGYALRRMVFGALRLKTIGVKVMLLNEAGEILLIRNGYGDSSFFLLPGGGVSRRESPQAAAIREVREELGVAIEHVEPFWTYESGSEGKRDTIHLFKARTSETVEIDDREVIEARFFRLDALPDSASPATRRRIAELRGERPIDGSW